MATPTLELAGFPAVWTGFEIIVEDEVAAQNIRTVIGAYSIAEPERWIDSAALLREREIADPPYWALVWTGACAITARLSKDEALRGLRVLDLGCGLGISGIAAARAGATVMFADYLDEPLEFVRASVAAAGIDGCSVARVDFTRDTLGERFDLILAADIVYEPAHYAALADFLTAHLAPGGVILLTESLRADARMFLEGMRERGFEDRVRPMWVMEDRRRERTWLHELYRSR